MKTKLTDKAEITYALINNVSGNRKTETKEKLSDSFIFIA